MAYTVDMLIRTPAGLLANLSKTHDDLAKAQALYDSLAPTVHSHIRLLILHDGKNTLSVVHAPDKEA